VDGATVSVAVVASRTEAELIVGMLDSTRRCRSRGFGCWLPPPMKPRPVGFSPPPMTPSPRPVNQDRWAKLQPR
jgi:hypothetical protein